jgi:hypothetical protein
MDDQPTKTTGILAGDANGMTVCTTWRPPTWIERF